MTFHVFCKYKMLNRLRYHVQRSQINMVKSLDFYYWSKYQEVVLIFISSLINILTGILTYCRINAADRQL